MNLPTVIFDFQKDADLSNWYVVDDVVMGGESSGSFSLNEAGHGVFQGQVSLENNGGFSSVRYQFPRVTVDPNATVRIRLKGEGKRYQLRIKNRTGNYYSYVHYFQTSGEWQEIDIQLSEMYPTFRGRKLDMPNFSEDQIEEVAFLIGNKKPESFRLEVDKIELVKE